MCVINISLKFANTKTTNTIRTGIIFRSRGRKTVEASEARHDHALTSAATFAVSHFIAMVYSFCKIRINFLRKKWFYY